MQSKMERSLQRGPKKEDPLNLEIDQKSRRGPQGGPQMTENCKVERRGPQEDP